MHTDSAFLLRPGEITNSHYVSLEFQETFDQIIFRNCNAGKLLDGGALCLKCSNISITKCAFFNCTAPATGGAASIQRCYSLKIEDSLIHNNYAGYSAGALSLILIFEASLSNDNYTMNKCLGKISSLSIISSTEISIDKCYLCSNKALMGPALRVDSGNTQLSSVTFFHLHKRSPFLIEGSFFPSAVPNECMLLHNYKKSIMWDSVNPIVLINCLFSRHPSEEIPDNNLVLNRNNVFEFSGLIETPNII